jgi:glucosamine--fructose-6-phosphate aminotransferase (isomerizing)
MCGIFGYVGSQKGVPLLLEGLKKLEYRGYDSAGIAGVNPTGLVICKEAGKVSKLEGEVQKQSIDFCTGIAHTRWATHGSPTQKNAHPHINKDKTLALVHNGIIENHDSLRRELMREGVEFISETDTEVVAQLIGFYYKGDLLNAVQKAVARLQGSYAFAVLHKNHPNQIALSCQDAPLAVGIGNGETFISSDTNAFLVHTRDVVFLRDSEVALVEANRLQVFDKKSEEIIKKRETLEHSAESSSKGKFDHYTLKEIFEQPQSLRNAMLSRYIEKDGNALLDEMNLSVEDLKGVERILILACGTSWHAGFIASYLLEEKARIPVQVEISSEYRYKNPVVSANTLVIAISQSGETADTMAAVRELKAKGAKIVAICNVQGSALTREAHGTLYLRSGPEIGVCSTKAFTSQLVVLTLFTLYMARMRDMSKEDGRVILAGLKQLPEIVGRVLAIAPTIEAIAKRYSKYENFFFLGRHLMFPTALEGALKIKEIAYVNANGYPAGELKHGPIALINPDCPTVALCTNELTYMKILSNLQEVKARSGKIIAIAFEGAEGVKEIADEVISIPRCIDELAAIPGSVVLQLFAYYVARERGAEIDQPRNLAKSVTVE